MPCQRRVHSAYEYAGSQDPTRMSPEGLEKTEVQQLMNELFNLTDDNFIRSSDRMHAFKLGRPVPKVNRCCYWLVLPCEYCLFLVDDLLLILSQIGDVDRCAVYVSLAPSMENPAGMDLPEGDDARCLQYTSSEEEQNRPAPTTEDMVAGKRPLAVDPSPAEALPAESSQAPKRHRLVRIADDDEEEEEAAPSLVRRSHSRLNVAAITGDWATSDPPAPHTEPTRLGATEVAAATGRTRRRVFTATHRRSDL